MSTVTEADLHAASEWAIQCLLTSGELRNHAVLFARQANDADGLRVFETKTGPFWQRLVSLIDQLRQHANAMDYFRLACVHHSEPITFLRHRSSTAHDAAFCVAVEIESDWGSVDPWDGDPNDPGAIDSLLLDCSQMVAKAGKFTPKLEKELVARCED